MCSYGCGLHRYTCSSVCAVAWFPRTLLAELLALPDWTAVKASLTHMLSLGMLRQLVPFGERLLAELQQGACE